MMESKKMMVEQPIKREPRVRTSYRRCFNPRCEGWITAEYHGEFRYGKVRYRQYMDCKCNACQAESRELVRSQVDGQPELNGPRFLLHDPELERFYELPGFGQSILPWRKVAYHSGMAMEELMQPMMMSWLNWARGGAFEESEC